MNQQRDNSRDLLGILVGGGPAPGINGVISAVTIEAIECGLDVVGIYDGYKWIARGDTRHTRPLEIRGVSRIHFDGGSILRTSRENPTKSEETLQRTVQTLKDLHVKYLVTIGGDDTAFAASQIAKRAAGEIRVAHVPKTVDNDLPLPGNMPTFGFQTARHVGFTIVQNLMEDSQTTGRWYFIVAMGRKAGHLALGIGKAAGATLTIIGEEFEKPRISLAEVGDILEGAMLKRRAMGRSDGVAIIAEGIAEKFDPEELRSIPGVEIHYDNYGHIRLGEIDIGKMLKHEISRRFGARGEKLTIVTQNIGYELRCASPIPFDCEYVRDLGYGAVKYLLDLDVHSKAQSGAMVCIEEGVIKTIPFEQMLDPATGKTRVRMVDIHTDSYRVARSYMIRLEREDFEKPELLSAIAAEAKMTVEDFRKKFGPVVGL